MARNAFDITDGIEDGALAGLTDDQAQTLLTLMSRLAERSYRRGFQQGVGLGPTLPAELEAGLHDWRYGISTDTSPGGDQPAWRSTSIERLHLENKELHRLSSKFNGG